MEIWDLYDKNRQRTGEILIRGNVCKQGSYHLVVQIWIINSKGELLIQQRSANKETCPNVWATTTGSVISGENTLQGSIREVKEEIGIKFQYNELKLVGSYIDNVKGYICDVYLVKKNIDLNDIIMDEEEVQKVEWLTLPQINELIEQGKFTMSSNIKGLKMVLEALKDDTN